MTIKSDVLANGVKMDTANAKLDDIIAKLNAGGTVDLAPVLTAVADVKTDVGGVKTDTVAILSELQTS